MFVMFITGVCYEEARTRRHGFSDARKDQFSSTKIDAAFVRHNVKVAECCGKATNGQQNLALTKLRKTDMPFP